MTAVSVVAQIAGESPILMHSIRLSDPLDPITREIARLAAKRAKTDADYERLARLEWFGGLWTFDDRPCLPIKAIEGALVEAARTRRLGKKVLAGLICETHATLKYDGPRDLEELWADPAFRFRASVRVQGNRVMRTRPKFPSWSAELHLQFLPTLLNERSVYELLEIAGDQIGIGDWRPKFGRFRVVSFDYQLDSATRGHGTARRSKAAPGPAGRGLPGLKGGARSPSRRAPPTKQGGRK